jgi:cell division protein FtsB
MLTTTTLVKKKKFGENEILKKLLEKMENLENEIKQLKNENQKLSNENKKLKSKNNKISINNINKPLNEEKSEKKVDEQLNNDLLFGSSNECYNRNHLMKLINIGNHDDIKR